MVNSLDEESIQEKYKMLLDTFRLIFAWFVQFLVIMLGFGFEKLVLKHG